MAVGRMQTCESVAIGLFSQKIVNVDQEHFGDEAIGLQLA